MTEESGTLLTEVLKITNIRAGMRLVVKTLAFHIRAVGLESQLQLLSPVSCQCGSWEAVVMTQITGFLSTM